MNKNLQEVETILGQLKKEAQTIKDKLSGDVKISERRGFFRKKYYSIKDDTCEELIKIGEGMLVLEKNARTIVNSFAEPYKNKYFGIEGFIRQVASVLNAGRQIHQWNIGLIEESKTVLKNNQYNEMIAKYQEILNNANTEMSDLNNIVERLLKLKTESVINAISNIPTQFNSKMSLPTKSIPSITAVKGIYLPHLMNYLTKTEYTDESKLDETIPIIKSEADKYIENMDFAIKLVSGLDELSTSKELTDTEELLNKTIANILQMKSTIERLNSVLKDFGEDLDKKRQEELEKVLVEIRKKEIEEFTSRFSKYNNYDISTMSRVDTINMAYIRK